jgi:tRNA pseudouridine32 synthase/23S rRNA pseudouridine746 synthase
MPLDGKEALTELDVESFDPESDTSVVSLSIKTGRLHQIRRHLEMIGHPVMGDSRYGKGNKNPEGLRLSAVSLHFFCPFQQKEVEFNMPSRSEVEKVGRSLNSDGDTVPRNI